MFALAALLMLPVAPVSFEVLHKYVIGGEGGWDYLTLDSKSHRLYISRSTRVMVMDTVSGKIVGTIEKTAGVHGIAMGKDGVEGYTSNGRDDTVSVFDPKTLKISESIKVGKNPDAILYDSSSDRVFTFNGRSSDATVLDAKSHKVIGTIPLGGKPEFAQADGKGTLWVNIEDTAEIKELDTKAMKVRKVWSIKPGEDPTGLAYDAKGHRLFSVCGNQKMIVSDSKSGKMSFSAEIGKGPDAVGFDSLYQLALSSNGADGTISVIDMKGKCVQTVKTMVSARTMIYDDKEHRAYLIAAEFDAPTAGSPRGKMKAGSATIVVVGTK